MPSALPEWTHFAFYVPNCWMGLHGFGMPLLRTWILLASDNPMLTLAALLLHLDSLAMGAAICLMSRDARLRTWLNRRTGAALLVAAGIPLARLVWLTGLAPYALTSRLQRMRLPGNAWFLTLFLLVCGAVLILALRRVSRRSSALTWRPLRALGKISYGVYLYYTLGYFLVSTMYQVFVFLPLPGIYPGEWDLPAINAAQMALTVAMAAGLLPLSGTSAARPDRSLSLDYDRFPVERVAAICRSSEFKLQQPDGSTRRTSPAPYALRAFPLSLNAQNRVGTGARLPGPG